LRIRDRGNYPYSKGDREIESPRGGEEKFDFSEGFVLEISPN